jgi:hypothetical protein
VGLYQSEGGTDGGYPSIIVKCALYIKHLLNQGKFLSNKNRNIVE